MSDDAVRLEIATPTGSYVDTFRKTAKVQDVISEAVREKDLDQNEPFELFWSGNALKPEERTLVSFGLEGTVQLELVATGSGV